MHPFQNVDCHGSGFFTGHLLRFSWRSHRFGTCDSFTCLPDCARICSFVWALRHKWVDRMILGDSLVVMNSLFHYEGLGGQVQMIYMDPAYGVKVGSNFQPFVRKRNVSHNADEDMTREPEMVQAYLGNRVALGFDILA